MNKSFDLFIGKLIKNWVDQHQPPVNGRSRLLMAAAQAGSRGKKRISAPSDYRLYVPHHMRPDDCAQVLMILVNETVFRAGLQIRVV